MHPNTFLKIVQEESGLVNLDQARMATQIVFDLLHHRITPGEAEDLEAQLPRELAEIWAGGPTWFDKILSRFTPQNRFNRQEFIDQVEWKKEDLPSDAERITKAVFYALQSQITRGEAEDVGGQLPRDLRQLWNESRPLELDIGNGGPMEPIQGKTPREMYKGYNEPIR